MSMFDVVVLLAALSGLVMVVGGIFLLARGAITLASTPQTNALSIEFRRQFRINTQVPGVAFFAVGLLFIVLALQFAKPPEVIPIEVDGEVSAVDAAVTIMVSTRWPLPAFTGGQIHSKIYPDVSTLVVEVSAPGHDPIVIPVEVKPTAKRTARIGKLALQKAKELVDKSKTKNSEKTPTDEVYLR